MKSPSDTRPESTNIMLTVLAVSATLITILLCSLPNDAIDPLYDMLRMVVRAFVGGGRGGGVDSPISTDKLAHFGVFAIVSALWMLRCKAPSANLWVLMGAIANRFAKHQLDWDTRDMRFRNNRQANLYLNRTYRTGWEIPDFGVV